MQVARLNAVGAWLKDNGEAIYETRPWSVSTAKANDGRDIRFTSRGARVYAVALDGGNDAISFEDKRLHSVFDWKFSPGSGASGPTVYFQSP